MPDTIDRLKAALSDRYTIEGELGSGGMAMVYLAEDVKHHRKVAIKILRPEVAASLGVERFVREIEIAANLTHPHILPLHDSGEADGFLYYVMPYIEGESLRERIDREGKLDIKEAIRLTDQVASALSHAHERGLVHRDIKPENILLAADQAIVADFGIARAVEIAGGERLTGTGLAVGTPAYMSPEQAMGSGEVDARSDVYALGCVVYEMVAGRAPFEGATPQELLAKHAVNTAPRLRTSDPSIPLFLERAVERALAKRPDERFQTASEFAEALTSEIVVARVSRRRSPWLAISGAMIVLLAAAALVLSNVLGGPAYERLAVLPPTNLMNDPEQAYFVQGVHNALITELQRAGVAVIARQSMLKYENTEMQIREIAQELGVDALIEASVMRAGDSVEIEVSLVDGATQQYVADPIVRRGEFLNVVALYRDLTGAIAAELSAALTPQAAARLATAQEVNPEAYENYLRGQFHFYKLTPADLEIALQYYNRALEMDPNYAPAYAGIALAWVGRSQMGMARPRDAIPQMVAAAERGVALDSTLADVQYAVATVSWHEWDWAAAEAGFRRAIELNPNYPDVRAVYSHYLHIVGRPDEATQQMERAVELDPFNPLIQAFNGNHLWMVGRQDEALLEFQRLVRTVPNHPGGLSGLQLLYAAKGMYEEAFSAATALWAVAGFSEAQQALAQGYAEGGYEEAMRRVADTLAALSDVTWVMPTDVALFYGLAGEEDRALAWLERGLEERDPGLPYISASPIWDGVRDDPRFQDLLRRMGLPQ